MTLFAAGADFWRWQPHPEVWVLVGGVAALAGYALIESVRPRLPFALGFAAGAMIYVVLEELIPSAHQSGRADLATSAAIGGFTLMMVLDVALG